MNLIADILSTIIEGCGLIYLVKEEQISGRRKILFVVLHMVIFQILTHLIYLDRIGLKLLIGTGNRYLDIILRDKRTKAEQSGIYFEDDIDFQRGGFVEAVDISTIFGNLLDNAIEACELIDENGKRFIQVTAKQKNSLLVISVKNSISDIPVDKDRKNKKIISGYGLLNVENAVHKYEGEISAVKEEEVFNVNIVLPIRKV